MTRLRLAWHVLRGRPLIYRCRFLYHPDNARYTRLDDTNDRVYVIENFYKPDTK